MEDVGEDEGAVDGEGGSSRCSMKDTWNELKIRSAERSQRRYTL